MPVEILQSVQTEFENSSFWKFIGLQLEELREGYALLALPIRSEFINVRQTLHGGIYASVLDTAMGMTARTLGYTDSATLQLNIQFLQSISEGTVYADAIIIHRNRTTLYLEGRLKDERGQLLAHCTGTFKVK